MEDSSLTVQCKTAYCWLTEIRWIFNGCLFVYVIHEGIHDIWSVVLCFVKLLLSHSITVWHVTMSVYLQPLFDWPNLTGEISSTKRATIFMYPIYIEAISSYIWSGSIVILERDRCFCISWVWKREVFFWRETYCCWMCYHFTVCVYDV